METECAKILWERSAKKHNLRYTTMLCDGDSKDYASIVASKIYGEDIDIEKEDCINHISIRMGIALRKLVATSKAQGAPI